MSDSQVIMGAAVKRMIWYHGGPKIRPGSVMSWDRDRGTRDLNAEGPGMYFTSSYDEASGYASDHSKGVVYRGKMKPGFKLLPKKRPSLPTLLLIYKTAQRDSKYTFLSNWGYELDEASAYDVEKALTNYTHFDSLHEALLALYHDLFSYDANEYVKSLEVLFDGVALDKGVIDGHRRYHLIVWNPGAIDMEEA